MNIRTKNMLKIVGEHLLFVVLSLFIVYTFTNLLGKHMYFVSIFTALLYVSSTYSAGWSVASKDYGRAREENRLSGNADVPINFRSYDGFIIALPNFVITLFFMIMAFASGKLWEVVYRLYNYSFIYILTDKANNLVLPACIGCAVVTYAAYGLGYIFGKNKKVFIIKYIPKLVYKSNDKK